ncbi:hypothetical protein GCM10025868_19880 [Angustibacter aerolatus]|uniref:SIS domain-containing protein n=1 Tax=Angustibacter aerolatus TaxID=1162965 RepID=A0ABQ6JEW8_9ACTN|nr:hypothetical protein [Angustibacter aerolatus]GMA86738.1 hypothetical protein GCM10025868_19880 [Angustibacter aerolatus]
MSLPVGLPTVVVTAVPQGPVVDAAAAALVLDFADETSVVQTRFATAVVAVFRAAAGDDLSAAIAQAEQAGRGHRGTRRPARRPRRQRAVRVPRPRRQRRARARGGARLREACLATTESHPAMEYRHGPVALAGPGTAVVLLGPDAAGIAPEPARPRRRRAHR